MEEAKFSGLRFFLNRHIKCNDAVMFDIDETLIFMDGDQPNKPMIELARIADMTGYEVIIITARPDTPENRDYTKNQLDTYGIPYDMLMFTTHQAKGEVKKCMNKQFILSVGDMWTDVTETQHWIKLPDLYDKTFRTSSASHSLDKSQKSSSVRPRFWSAFQNR